MKQIYHLRIGRVYHISPTPIPPFKGKEREAVYVGKILVFGKKMNVFIQMGSSKYIDNSLKDFNDKTRYFGELIGREGYFHIATSKGEYSRVVKNVYKNKSKYVELKKSHAEELLKIGTKEIIRQEKIRGTKAYAMWLMGKDEESIKQLNLLKYTMAGKYKYLKPTKQHEKWKKKQDAK